MSQNEHDWAWGRLTEYAGGGLAAEEAQMLEAHVAVCGDCTAALEELSREEVPPVAPPTRWQRTTAFLKSGTLAARAMVAFPLVALLAVLGFIISELETRPAIVVSEESRAQPLVIAKARAQLQRDVFERRGIPKDDVGMQGQGDGAPAIFFPESKEADHNESADNEEYKLMKGDSAEFLSYIRGEAGGIRGRQTGRSPGVYDTMGVGVGGGGGGRYGGRYGGISEKHVAANGRSSVNPEYFKPTDALEAARERPADVVGAAPQPLEKIVRDPAPQDQEPSPDRSRKIIRTGEMEFEVDSFDQTVSALTVITLEEKGFVGTVNSEKLQNGKVRGTIVVRVPPENLDRLLLKLRALGELKSQRIGSQDVTKLYTDLEGRLRAARAMEERLLAIIKEGKGQIKDLLAAEKELGEWRTRIESMVGEINYYSNLVAHSTLTVILNEKEIRAPFAVLETEHVEMALEVEDVEKAHRDALAAVTEAKGRVTRSELKQLAAGQFNAIVAFAVPPAQAGTLRDRLKQLGVIARLDLHRSQETQGGSGLAQDAKLTQKETQMLVSLYNLANLAPRETVALSLASKDPAEAFRSALQQIEKAAGVVLSSQLLRPGSDQTTGSIRFQVRTPDADLLLRGLQSLGEVLRLEIVEAADVANATRSKRGFQLTLASMAAVQSRETTTVVLAADEVGPSYRALLDGAKAVNARILNAQLNENDAKNVTASLSLDVRREDEEAIAAAMKAAGRVYTRSSTRLPEGENVVDTKIRLDFRLFSASNIPPSEIVKIGLRVSDVEATAASLESEFRSRLVDVRHERESSGSRRSVLEFDVPAAEARAVTERIRKLGALNDHSSAKAAGVPESPLAKTRLQVGLSDEVLVSNDSGPAANVRRGLAISLTAASWALMLVMIGVCFVLPIALLFWLGVRLYRRLHPKVQPAPSAG